MDARDKATILRFLEVAIQNLKEAEGALGMAGYHHTPQPISSVWIMVQRHEIERIYRAIENA